MRDSTSRYFQFVGGAIWKGGRRQAMFCCDNAVFLQMLRCMPDGTSLKKHWNIKKNGWMPNPNKIRILHTETHKLLMPLPKILFDITGYQWYITRSGCATETCDARSRWSSMRGLHSFIFSGNILLLISIICIMRIKYKNPRIQNGMLRFRRAGFQVIY